MDFQENDNTNKEVMSIFQTESEEIIERIFSNLFSLEDNPADKSLVGAVYRDLHSLKGAVRMVGFNNIQTIIHKMEDIFDAINNDHFLLTHEVVNLMSHSLEVVSNYLQESVKNGREIIGEDFSTTISSLEYIIEVEIKEQSEEIKPSSIASIAALENMQNDDTISHQEEINYIFNNCFEIIDSIVPEEESQDIVVLKEEVQKIYEYFKDEDNLALINKLKESNVNTIYLGSNKFDESNVFFDKKVVLTGSLVEFTRSEASKILEDLGAHVVSSVSKATDFVLCGSDPGSKFDKAKKLGIRIISEEEFKVMIGGKDSERSE